MIKEYSKKFFKLSKSGVDSCLKESENINNMLKNLDKPNEELALFFGVSKDSYEIPHDYVKTYGGIAIIPMCNGLWMAKGHKCIGDMYRVESDGYISYKKLETKEEVRETFIEFILENSDDFSSLLQNFETYKKNFITYFKVKLSNKIYQYKSYSYMPIIIGDDNFGNEIIGCIGMNDFTPFILLGNTMHFKKLKSIESELPNEIQEQFGNYSYTLRNSTNLFINYNI